MSEPLVAELTLTPPELPSFILEAADVIVESPGLVEPPAIVEGVLPFPTRVVAAAAPAPAEPELNPIEAAQVELLERWLESIKASRSQDHDPAQ